MFPIALLAIVIRALVLVVSLVRIRNALIGMEAPPWITFVDVCTEAIVKVFGKLITSERVSVEELTKLSIDVPVTARLDPIYADFATDNPPNVLIAEILVDDEESVVFVEFKVPTIPRFAPILTDFATDKPPAVLKDELLVGDVESVTPIADMTPEAMRSVIDVKLKETGPLKVVVPPIVNDEANVAGPCTLSIFPILADLATDNPPAVLIDEALVEEVESVVFVEL